MDGRGRADDGCSVGDLAWDEIGKGITRKRGSDDGLSRDSIAPLLPPEEKHLIQGMVLPVLALLFLLASPAGLRLSVLLPQDVSPSKLLTLGALFQGNALKVHRTSY